MAVYFNRTELKEFIFGNKIIRNAYINGKNIFPDEDPVENLYAWKLLTRKSNNTLPNIVYFKTRIPKQSTTECTTYEQYRQVVPLQQFVSADNKYDTQKDVKYLQLVSNTTVSMSTQLIDQPVTLELAKENSIIIPFAIQDVQDVQPIADETDTNYDWSEFQITDDNVYIRAEDEDLDVALTFPFGFRPQTVAQTFVFEYTCAGTFWIDWGDGSGIEKTDVRHYLDPETGEPTGGVNRTFRHTYNDGKPANEHVIWMGGKPILYQENYAGDDEAATIYFGNDPVAEIFGSIGKVFKTLGFGPGQQPKFYRTFWGSRQIKSIPNGFFDGLYGLPGRAMFRRMFESCSGLEEIPEGLFKNIYGDCSEVSDVFRDCFKSCSSLKAIPDIFGNIYNVPNREFFWAMFYECTSAKGPAPKINGQYIWDIYPNYVTQMFTRCQLDEMSIMPNGYKT